MAHGPLVLYSYLNENDFLIELNYLLSHCFLLLFLFQKVYQYLMKLLSKSLNVDRGWIRLKLNFAIFYIVLYSLPTKYTSTSILVPSLAFLS